jgi:hypothetical protein
MDSVQLYLMHGVTHIPLLIADKLCSNSSLSWQVAASDLSNTHIIARSGHVLVYKLLYVQ